MSDYRIDSLPVGGGTVGLCCCPGHRLTPRFVRPALDSLEADLDTIAAYGASHLVTLMQAHELAYVGVDPGWLAGAAAARGLAWLHLPIRNLSPPGADWEAGWQGSGATLRRVLAEGGRFALHCYAGLGRTGTVAARLLMEHGASPVEAIAAVRSARPGSIETMEQENYILGGRWKG